MKESAILLDTTYCTGCNSCAYRCIQEFRYHDKAAKGLFRTFVQINDDGLYQKRQRCEVLSSFPADDDSQDAVDAADILGHDLSLSHCARQTGGQEQANIRGMRCL